MICPSFPGSVFVVNSRCGLPFRRRQRVIAAVSRAAADGTEITTRAGPPADSSTGPAVTRASPQADLLAAQERALRGAAP